MQNKCFICRNHRIKLKCRSIINYKVKIQEEKNKLSGKINGMYF